MDPALVRVGEIELEAQGSLIVCLVLVSGRFDRNNTAGASVFNFFHNEDEV